MSEPKSIKSWLARAFITLCVFVISVSLAILLVRFEFSKPLGAILFGLAVFFGFLFLQRQNALARDVKAVKANTFDLAAYENNLQQKIEKMSQQNIALDQDTISTTEQGNIVIQDRLRALEKRLGVLENAASILPSASMAPFHQAAENIETDENADEKKIAKLDKAKLKDALKPENLQMHLQPIVALPSRTPIYFDAFMRLKTDANDYLDGYDFHRLAEDGGLLPTIDTKILFSSVRLIRTLKSLKKSSGFAGLFCSISARTLEDSKAYKQILDFLEANQSIKKSLILEVKQRDYLALKSEGQKRLGNIADLGFSLSLGEVENLRLDADALTTQGFRFIKVPVSILLHANLDDDHESIKPNQLSSLLKEQDMTLIAIEIENENQAVSSIDFDVDYGQGLLFAPPRAVKAELLKTK